MGFMHGTEPMTPPPDAGLSILQNTLFSAALTDGVKWFSFLSAMIRSNALTAKRKWHFLSCILITKEFPWMNFMKGPWLRQKPGWKPNAVPLDFFSCLYHTVLINRQEASAHGRTIHQGTQTEIYPPEGMTAPLVKNMTDGDLLDMHYFLTEDDDLDDASEEGFYIFWPHCPFCCARLLAGFYYVFVVIWRTFLL